MATVSNIPKDLQESIRNELDKKVKVSIKRLVKMEIRGDKTDNRVLAFSPCRMFILTAKVPAKVEHSFHFMEIQGIESKKPGQLTVTVVDKDYKFISVEPGSEELDHMIIHLGISLKQIFPSFPLERLIVKMDIQPEDRLKSMQEMIKNMEGKEIGPCGGYTTMYRCMCDFHNLPFREEVAWDVDTIYLSHDSHELRLLDFDHLHSKDLVPIISALEHNTWFKAINGSNVRLTLESCNEILKVMRRNAIIEELNLSNTGIKGDFVQKLSTALISNSGSQLQRIDLSNNILDERALTHLLGAMKILPCGLTSLDLSKTGISTKCINKIGEVFSQSPAIPPAITTVNLSDNGVRGEDFPMLYNFIAQPNSITVLDLSSTDCALDALCDPLLRGCPSLSTLKLSRTVFSHKRSKEPVVPHSWKQLFASACCLESLDLSSCRLPAEALKDLLMGMASNRNMKALTLDVSSNELGAAGLSVLISCIPEIKNLKCLDISNNGFDSELRTLLPELSKNSHLKGLSIGRNFSNVKAKYMPEIMTSLVQLVQNETSTLEFLSIADSKLKSDATYVINALGSNDSLKELDISGNLIGDHGARMLAKALQINTKLYKVVWDKNNISAQGFEDVADSLKKNMTMKQMPFPVNDASTALRLQPERTETALQKIESFLQRNHCPRRFASDQAYRLQQGFLISSTQQILDRKIVQVQDTINALNSLGSLDVYADDVASAENLLKDADKSRQLLPSLQDIALTSQSAGNPVDEKLQDSKNNLQATIVEHLKKTLEDMLTCTSSTCPAVMANETFQSELKEGCQSKLVTRKDFMQGILEGAAADIYNYSGEINLAVASLISDSVVDEVIESLSTTHKTLSNHLSLRRSGVYKDITDESDGVVATRSVISEKASPKPTDKRMSMINRKTRPQSTMARERLKRKLSSDNNLSDKAKPENSVPACPDERGLDAISDSPITKEENGRPAIIVDVAEPIDFDELPSVSIKPLNHVSKSRPRREKHNRPTRPVLETGSTDIDSALGVDNGINPMYLSTQSSTSVASPSTASASVRKTSKEETQSSSSSVPGRKPSKDELGSSTKGDSQKGSSSKTEENLKPEGKSDSKKWSPMSFLKGKSSKEDKVEKEKEKESKKGSSFSIFKKKDDKKRPSTAEAPTVETTNAEQEPEKSLEPVKDDTDGRRPSTGSASSSGDKNTVDVTEKSQPKEETEKPSPIRPPREKVALLPQVVKREAKLPTLAKEEDSSLSEKEAEEKDANIEEKKEEKTEDKPAGPKLPPGVAKMGGLAALGNKSLLDQLKEKQVKRGSSYNPPTSTSEETKIEEAVKTKDTSASTTTPNTPPITKETNNNVSNSAKTSSNIPDKSAATDDAKTSVEGESLKIPSGGEEAVKKEPSPSPPQKSSPTIPSKYPLPAPRGHLTKRPLSTSVLDSGSSPAPSPTSSGETELKEGDRHSTVGPVAKPRPPPPLKPRPPLAPRPNKRNSSAEESTDSKESTRPSSQVLAAIPAESTAPTDTACDNESKSNVGGSEIVYDSATLRMNVKDKIKRIAGAQSHKEKPTAPSVKPAIEKAKSLPKNSKLPLGGDGDSATVPEHTSDPTERDQEIPKSPVVIPASPVSSVDEVSHADDTDSSKDVKMDAGDDNCTSANQNEAEEDTEVEAPTDKGSETSGGDDVIMV